MATVLRLVRLLVVLAILAAVALFVWPTRYRYDHMTVDGNLVPVRIDRITGDADMLVPDDGWEPVEAPQGASSAPPETRTLVDTSAAAIAASGMLRLARLVPDSLKGHLYWSTAVRILKSLCDQYLAKPDPKWEGILKGGVYHVHKSLGVDESVMWGEYFFVEALQRVLR